jgi:uncharacterized Zn finger protein
MQVVMRTVYRCRVCGSAEVRTDEVVDRGLVLLAECPRCEHRWTESPPGGRSRSVASRSVREVAPAA